MADLLDAESEAMARLSRRVLRPGVMTARTTLINHQLLVSVYELLPRGDAGLNQERKCVKTNFMWQSFVRVSGTESYADKRSNPIVLSRRTRKFRGQEVSWTEKISSR